MDDRDLETRQKLLQILQLRNRKLVLKIPTGKLGRVFSQLYIPEVRQYRKF